MSDGLNKIATVSEAKNSVKYGIRPRPSLLVFDLLRSDHSIFLKENLPSRTVALYLPNIIVCVLIKIVYFYISKLASQPFPFQSRAPGGLILLRRSVVPIGGPVEMISLDHCHSVIEATGTSW